MSDVGAPPPPPPTPAAAPAVPVPSDAEWPARAADLVDTVVAGVHDRLVRPLAIVARAVVFGVIVGTMALVMAVLGSVAVIRLLDVYAFGSRRVWA